MQSEITFNNTDRMKKIFSTSAEVNTGRQWSLDFAKFIAILSMVAVHTFIYFYGEENMDYGFQYRLNNIYGGVLAAPAFMFAMGAGVAYSRNARALVMLQRGIKLVVAGYLLNVLRSLPPLLLWQGGYGSEYYDAFLEELLLFDILHFAGFAFMLLALLQRLRLAPARVFAVGLALSVFGTYVRSVDTGSLWSNLLCYPFVGVHTGSLWSSFPLANWFIFVATGYWFGKHLRRQSDPDRFYALLTPFAAFVFTIGMIYFTHRALGMFGEDSDDAFYYLTPVDALICLSGSLMVSGIGHFLMPHEPRKLSGAVRQISTDVTRIYLIHWFFVSYLVGGILVGMLGWVPHQFVALLLSMVILAVSAWLARLKPFSSIKI